MASNPGRPGEKHEGDLCALTSPSTWELVFYCCPPFDQKSQLSSGFFRHKKNLNVSDLDCLFLSHSSSSLSTFQSRLRWYLISTRLSLSQHTFVFLCFSHSCVHLCLCLRMGVLECFCEVCLWLIQCLFVYVSVSKIFSVNVSWCVSVSIFVKSLSVLWLWLWLCVACVSHPRSYLE